MPSGALDSIKRELKRLDCEPWMRPITTIVNNFEGYPIDFDEWLPEVQILVALKQLQAGDPEQIRVQFVNCVMNLNCFSYRAFRLTDMGPKFWDPLSCSFRRFVSDDPGVRFYQADTIYPAADIIQAWFFHKLKDPGG